MPFRDAAKPVAGERFLRRRCDVSGIAPLGGNLKRKGVKVEAWGLRDTKATLLTALLPFSRSFDSVASKPSLNNFHFQCL